MVSRPKDDTHREFKEWFDKCVKEAKEWEVFPNEPDEETSQDGAHADTEKGGEDG